MRNNSYVLFGGMGFAGGALGALAAEVVSMDEVGPILVMALQVALWAGIFAAILCVGLFWAIQIYHRKPGIPVRLLLKAALSGAIAGAVAGGIAQLVYSLPMESQDLKQHFLKPACWGIAGTLIGWRFSKVIPNLGTSRGLLAGSLGGIVGGYGFIFSCTVIPDILGRMFGVAVLGAALGLAMVVVEQLFRKAALDVVWAPNEITSVTLGPQPVYIGGGDDHIYVSGLPQHAAAVTFDQGKIEYRDGNTGQTMALKSGSRIKIGKVEIVVRTQT